MEKIQELIKKFNPQKHYQYNETEINVDGVLVRPDENWINFTEGNQKISADMEDILPDIASIRSARVSTGRDSKEINKRAIELIKALYEGRHLTPFEGGAIFRLRVRTPINLAPPFFQLPYAHNEFSGRYSIIDGPLSLPGHIKNNSQAKKIFEESGQTAQNLYKDLIEFGIAREQARLVLPFRFFTEFFWTVSLRHLLELLALEENCLTPKGFWEIRDNIIKQIVADWCPWSFEAFQTYPRTIATHWIFDFSSETDLSYDNIAKNHMHQIQVKNIGKITLLSFNGNENFLKKTVITGPNPARGLGHVSLTFAVEMPIFVFRQWVRHRYSTWTVYPPDFKKIVARQNFYVPNSFRKQQGRIMDYKYVDCDFLENNTLKKKFHEYYTKAVSWYANLRGLEISMRDACQILPYSFPITAVWTVNLESLINFLSLRCDTHAQWEIRQYANQLYEWFVMFFPELNQIFLKHLNYGHSEIFEK